MDERTYVLKTGFDNVTMDEAVERAMELIRGRRSAYVVTPNPEIVWLCRKEPELQEAVRNAALVLPDGIGIIYGARILGRPLKEKVPGADFAENLFARLAKERGSVYLLGAKPGVAERAGEKLREKYPGLVISGAEDGYFTDEEPVAERINGAKPDFLVVCLGAPKQELWMSRWAGRLDVGVMAGLGGCLDVFAGEVARAPERWRRLNLEWLYRLLKQPSRFGRMLKIPAFLFAVVLQRVREV